MLHNITHKFTKIIEASSQEGMYNCPHYLGMSYDQIKASGVYLFLIKLLNQFPFDGNINILSSIKEQDKIKGK